MAEVAAAPEPEPEPEQGREQVAEQELAPEAEQAREQVAQQELASVHPVRVRDMVAWVVSATRASLRVDSLSRPESPCPWAGASG